MAAREAVEGVGGRTCRIETMYVRIVEAGGPQNTDQSALPKGKNAIFVKDWGILRGCAKARNQG